VGGAHGAVGSGTRPCTQKDNSKRCGCPHAWVLVPGPGRNVDCRRQLHEADRCACFFTLAKPHKPLENLSLRRGRAIQHGLVQAQRVRALAQLRMALRHALQQRERVIVRVRARALEESQRLRGRAGVAAGERARPAPHVQEAADLLGAARALRPLAHLRRQQDRFGLAVLAPKRMGIGQGHSNTPGAQHPGGVQYVPARAGCAGP
jgi:hypothetical protein